MKTKLLTILFLLIAGCSPTEEQKADVQTRTDEPQGEAVDEEPAGDDDSAVDEEPAGDDDSAVDEEPASLIHGGSPPPVTWTDCNQWPGSHPCDFSLIDQYGDTFTLYDNYDTVMVLDFSTMWCSVCKNIAPLVQPHQDAYGPRGFLWVTVLVEDAQGNDPDEEDIQAWADTYGITSSPVLAGNRADFVDLSGTTGYPISAWPTLVVIDRGMILVNGINGWNESVVMGWAEDAL